MTTIYVPFSEPSEQHPPTVSRKEPLEHGSAVVVLVDNGREGAAEILTELGATLVKENAIASFVVWRKPSSSRPVNEEEIVMLATTADLVVAGVGSCGACTAGSVEDAIRFERHGIPSALLITDAFIETADAVAEALGMPGYPHTTVPHPIGNRDDIWWGEAARQAAPQILGDLTRDSEGAKSLAY